MLVTRKLKVFFNNFIGYASLIRLNLMFSMSLWMEFQLLQILNNPSIRHFIKLILYENEVLKFKRSPVQVDSWYVWSVRFWLLLPEMNTSRKAMEWTICFSIVNLMLGCLLFKKLKNLVNLVHCQMQLECHQHILNKI